MHDFRRLRDNVQIVLGDGRRIFGIGIGKVVLGGKLVLTNMLYAPEMEVSVMSIRALTRQGFMVIHHGDEGLVIDGKEQQVLLRSKYDEAEGLFMVSHTLTHSDNINKHSINAYTSRSNFKHTSENTSKSVSEFIKWHRRLGHINPARMRLMANSSLVEGLKPGMFNLSISPSCEACILGKQTMLPRKAIHTPPSSNPIELLHVDICGPFVKSTIPGRTSTKPVYGITSFLTVVDDFTRYVWTPLLADNGEASKKLLDLVILLENQLSPLKVKRIRLDQAFEFHGNEIKKLLVPRGIQVEIAGSYAHEQNPKAERMNRTLQASGRTQMIQAGLPETFWPEAIRMATLTENHGVTRAPRSGGPAIPKALLISGTTNSEIEREREVVKVDYLRPFGCKAYVTIPPEKQTKTLSEPRAWTGIFLSHETSNTYRVWNPSSRSIRLVRDVRFDEDDFPARDIRYYTKNFGDQPRTQVVTDLPRDVGNSVDLPRDVGDSVVLPRDVGNMGGLPRDVGDGLSRDVEVLEADTYPRGVGGALPRGVEVGSHEAGGPKRRQVGGCGSMIEEATYRRQQSPSKPSKARRHAHQQHGNRRQEVIDEVIYDSITLAQPDHLIVMNHLA